MCVCLSVLDVFSVSVKLHPYNNSDICVRFVCTFVCVCVCVCGLIITYTNALAQVYDFAKYY